MTTITHFSHPEHPLILKEVGFVPEKRAVCYSCGLQISEPVGTTSDSDIYSCTICENFFLHDYCAHIKTQITHIKHVQHPLTLLPRMPSQNRCKLCRSKSKVFAYRCNSCDFDVCVLCVYNRHPEHLLLLEKDIGDGVRCDGCHEPLTDSTFYTSTSNSGQKYYLHRTCVKLPAKINHSSHTHCDLLLNLRLPLKRICDLCFRSRFTYRCVRCDYDVCIKCAVKDNKVIHHEGHKHHSLTFQYREALFPCNACREKAEESSYRCNTCDFWIHESCASMPTTISATTYHHHPLHLIYSIPDMHRTFRRFCDLCKKYVYPMYWAYYCHRCTYFVQLRCATSRNRESRIKEIEGDCSNDDPDLVQFPLPRKESLFDFLICQFRKYQIEYKEDGIASVEPEDPPYLNGQHWSHMDHPLQELHLSTFKDEEDGEDDNERLMVCDGCIQPITDAYPSFYGCIQCRFFLHKFCASTLPRKLAAGASPFHPQHSLLLQKNKFYDLIGCCSCNLATNGFYYQCKTCDLNFDICCTFLPTSIKYEAHKSHPLVQREASNSECNMRKVIITESYEYECRSCSDFRIDKACIYYPSRMKHRFDSHSITLRYPLFFYEGVLYCQICEEQVDNNMWLYHCDDCDQSFHTKCIRPLGNVKVGQTIVHGIDNQKHTLKYVIKVLDRVKSDPYICNVCGEAFRNRLMLECTGCGYLVCIPCFRTQFEWQLIPTPTLWISTDTTTVFDHLSLQ